jgi:hypothetical protein
VTDHCVLAQFRWIEAMGFDKDAAPPEGTTTVPQASEWRGWKGCPGLRVDERVFASG